MRKIHLIGFLLVGINSGFLFGVLGHVITGFVIVMALGLFLLGMALVSLSLRLKGLLRWAAIALSLGIIMTIVLQLLHRPPEQMMETFREASQRVYIMTVIVLAAFAFGQVRYRGMMD